MIEEIGLCRTESAARELVSGRVREIIEKHRDRLRRRFGWVAIDASASVDASRRCVVINGHALLQRLSSSLYAEVLCSVGGTWRVRNEIAVSGIEFKEFFENRVEVWREHPADGGTEHLTTEWLRSDGPVQTLAVVRGATLVRTADGTVGWTVATPKRLGRLPVHHGKRRSDWNREARSFLGVPYKLGGTTHAGIDCSGLVQRLWRIVLGHIIPRHSRDQMAFLRLRGSTGSGVLLFTTDRGNPHVGVAIRSRRGVDVIHASSSRGCVVRDELDAYIALTKNAGHALIGTAARM
jgi:cell wall-associated NlpC family hydrolase